MLTFCVFVCAIDCLIFLFPTGSKPLLYWSVLQTFIYSSESYCGTPDVVRICAGELGGWVGVGDSGDSRMATVNKSQWSKPLSPIKLLLNRSSMFSTFFPLFLRSHFNLPTEVTVSSFAPQRKWLTALGLAEIAGLNCFSFFAKQMDQLHQQLPRFPGLGGFGWLNRFGVEPTMLWEISI